MDPLINKGEKVIKRLSKNCAKIVLFLLFLTSNIHSEEISVPNETPVGKKIVATLTDGPNGTNLWSVPSTLESETVGNKLFIWGNAGTYKIECIIIPLRKITVNDQTFDVIDGPIRKVDATFKIVGPIGPTPPKPPIDPPVTDVPFPTNVLTVLMLREAGGSGTLPLPQRNIFVSSKILKWCNLNCGKLDGQPAFRIWDDDYTKEMFRNTNTILTDAYFKIRPTAVTLPWIAISDGRKGFSGPLPMSIEETLALLEQFKTQ